MKLSLISALKNVILVLICVSLVLSCTACGGEKTTANSSETATDINSEDSDIVGDSDTSNEEDEDADDNESSKNDSNKKESSKKDSSKVDSGKNDAPSSEEDDYESEDEAYEEDDYESEDEAYEEEDYTEDEPEEESESSDNTTADSNSSSSRPVLMWGDKPLGDVSSSKASSLKPNSSNVGASDFVLSSDDSKTSATPIITVAAQVADNICVVAGICAKNTTRVNISGEKVTAVSVVPYAGKNNYYFSAQVNYTGDTTIKVTAEESGKKTSATATSKVSHEPMSQNYMERSEYSPVFGKNSRMHFYSAILSYSLGIGKLNAKMKKTARENISDIVSAADNVGAETIFLVIPSSADIYKETVPSPYTEFNGQRLHEEFTKIATSYGATVIYPIDTMKKHRNDGVGYQLYQYTDSHWSTYGAYWGTYDLLNHIGKKYSAAKPRAVSEMGFYTTEMHAGDAFFNFPRNIGFENYYGDGTTNTTKMKELTTLYRRTMPTNTLQKVYNNYNGLYLTNDNADAATVNNDTDERLPTALIMRDSYGKIAYDMLNDRFKTVYWGEFDNYTLPTNIISSKKPNYVIYMYSERNLLKIMLNSSDANILNLK